MNTNSHVSLDDHVTSKQEHRWLWSAPLLLAFIILITTQQTAVADDYRSRFKPVPTQFIAALADPDAISGDNAQTWGIWPLDPGPRGVRLDSYTQLLASDGVAPANWQFNNSQWWLEENGLIMEAPDFLVCP